MFATFLCLLAFAGLSGPGPDPFRAIDIDAAVRAASLERKCVVVSFGRAGEAESKKLDTTTWVEPKVREWLVAKAVAIKVDVEKRDDLSSRFRIHVVPTILFLNDAGIELDRITGYVDGRSFKPEAESILAGGDPVARVKKRLVGRENDPHLRIDLARAYSDRGQLQESLVEYAWCWDHGLESDPNFGEARRTFLLQEFLRLSRVYPAAGDALEERVSALSVHIDDCSASDMELVDFLTLNRLLQQDERTLRAYDAILSTDEPCLALKKKLGPYVVDPLIDSRRYKEALDLIGDFVAHFESLATAFKDEAKRLTLERPTDSATMIEANRRKLRIDGARLYEALLGALRYDDGDLLVPHILAFDAHGATYTALIRAALRVEAHGQARAIALRAYVDTRLTDAEKLEVKLAAREILQPK